MGLDWIPCRIEPGVDPYTIRQLIQQEQQQFLAVSGWVAYQMMPLADRDPFADQSENPSQPTPSQRLDDLLLFKREAHRVYVISRSEILPLEWRLDGYRTILPDELPDLFQTWVDYRRAVAAGRFRAYLEELLLYISSFQFNSEVREILRSARYSLGTTASWTQRPDLIKAREALLNSPEPSLVPLPKLDLDAPRRRSLDGDWQQLQQQFDAFWSLVADWNNAVQRRNWKFKPPEKFQPLELWIKRWLEDSWFQEFSEWLTPWIKGGYGLYRDCE